MIRDYGYGGWCPTVYPPTFIFVVEVDHKRALAAFQKGLDDLATIWPQVLEFAEKQDQAARVEHVRKMTLRNQYHEDRRAWQDAQDALREWKKLPFYQRSSNMPKLLVEPREYDEKYGGMMYSPCHAPMAYAVSSAESFLAALKKKRDIASVATDNYKMLESDAFEIVQWENGEAFESAKRRFLPQV